MIQEIEDRAKIEELGWKGIMNRSGFPGGMDDAGTPIIDWYVIKNVRFPEEGVIVETVFFLWAQRSPFFTITKEVLVSKKYSKYDWEQTEKETLFKGHLYTHDELSWVMDRCGIENKENEEYA